MARKVLTWICIGLAAIALFFVVCILVLFLAPGTEILGIRYVAKGTTDSEERRVQLEEVLKDGKFNGNIYIETYGVPVVIEYTPYYTSAVAFRQEFIGLTKTKSRNAELTTELDNDGNFHVVANELVPWLYSHKGEGYYYFNLTLSPFLTEVNLHISSNKSKVTIKDAHTYDTLEVKSSGELVVENDIFAKNLIYHTSKEVTIGEKISCENADLSSTGGNINVMVPLEGDLTAQTRGGDIRFVSCKSFNGTTDSGDITNYGEGKCSVDGEVKIKTRSGDINLGNVGTNAADEEDKSDYLNIETVSGSIAIGRMLDGDIVDDRGKVNIEFCRNLVLNNKTGDVKITDVSNELVLNGRNGKVTLGDGGTINNPTVKTTTGTITAYNTRGKVYLESKSNAVEFVNLDSGDIYLYAGRVLNATKLQGKVEAHANGDVVLTFAEGLLGLDLNVGNRGKVVDVDLSHTDYKTVNYNIKSTRGKKAKVYAGDRIIAEGSTAASTQVEGFPNINIKTTYGEVTLKFKESI